MIDEQRKRKAQTNVAKYLQEGLLKKEKNTLAKQKYLENAELSLKAAAELMKSTSGLYLWVIVISYYSMFYMANAVLLHLGYKTQDKIAHKVTSDALIALVLGKLQHELLEEYEEVQQAALEIAANRAEEIVESYGLELIKRSQFQYNMLEELKVTKAQTSLERAQRFRQELSKLLVN